MNEDIKRQLETQNKRIRRAADRMPTPGLAKTFKAIAYRADLNLSNDYCVVTHDFSMKTIAEQSKGKPYQRSERALRDDLNLLVDAEVAEVKRGQWIAATPPANRITLYLHKEVPADIVREAKQRRKANRKPKVAEVKAEAEATGHVYDPWCICDECQRKTYGCPQPSPDPTAETQVASGQGECCR